MAPRRTPSPRLPCLPLDHQRRTLRLPLPSRRRSPPEKAARHLVNGPAYVKDLVQMVVACLFGTRLTTARRRGILGRQSSIRLDGTSRITTAISNRLRFCWYGRFLSDVTSTSNWVWALIRRGCL